MSSPVSPIVAYLYMKSYEQKALSTAPTPRLWHQYMDDTFFIQKEEYKQNFLQHINNVGLAIHFIVENNKEDGAIPFLDIMVKPETDCKLSTTVYMLSLTYYDISLSLLDGQLVRNLYIQIQ